MADTNLYCSSLTRYSRYPTREVNIGDIPLGNFHPIRIQSMTTTDTMDTMGTVEQSIRMIEAGCEYVRITAPSLKEAENLREIKKELNKRGYTTPLIADIHYTPNAAELAARIVEKVRVNPGNYIDKKKFATIEYTDEEYNAELERIYERFSPLVKICKEYGTAMRIGTNHGSLSDRIMSRYGDSPNGMVESALEFVRICEDLKYYNIVLSMKSSNPQVMVQAYRLLVNRMTAEGMNYPLHLGVTEAGDGEDGRIKSAMGIGTLLEDGLGDTIRVSLTEEPEYEAPVAIAIVNAYQTREEHDEIPAISENPIDPFQFSKRKSIELIGIGGNNPPRVVADLSQMKSIAPDDLKAAGYTYNAIDDKWKLSDMAADFLFLGKNDLDFALPSGLRVIYDREHWLRLDQPIDSYPLMNIEQYVRSGDNAGMFNFLSLQLSDLNQAVIQKLRGNKNTIIVLSTVNTSAVMELRRAFIELVNQGIDNPVIVMRDYRTMNESDVLLRSSVDLGALLLDGFGDGVWIKPNDSLESIQRNNRYLFGILQAARARISKTEYIACPSCGRTLFNLVETTEKIRKRTSHLKGVKIAIMGCIVNGPGEMADADFGYVGSGPGRITLYKGREVLKRNIPSESAVNELIALIKENNQWVEPEE